MVRQLKQLLIVGAGPAGVFAAIIAARQGANVTLLERNEKPLRKLMITGKGRCNVTNACEDTQELLRNIPCNGRFLYSAFSRFSPADTIDFFEKQGVPLKTERGKRVFPASDRASDIVDALVRAARNSGCQLCQGRATQLQIDNGVLRGVVTQEGETLPADAVLIATGGLSYPTTGSTGDGYLLAQQAGHTVMQTSASLVPLAVHEGFCSRLMGLALRNVALTVEDSETNKTIYSDFGELLFTHFGVTGPLILSASAHMRPMERERYRLHIDLKPALTAQQLDIRVLRDFSQNLSRNFINSLNALLPKTLVPVVVNRLGIPLATKVSQITKDQRTALVNLLKDFTLTVTSARPIAEAVVTSGGVAVTEVDPKTMQSKRLPGLYFAGEVLDVDAYTGGFNLQIAFSTGYLAGLSAGTSN